MELNLSPTECHLPYGITQCYLPSDTNEHTHTPCLNNSQTSQTGQYSILSTRKDGRLS